MVEQYEHRMKILNEVKSQLNEAMESVKEAKKIESGKLEIILQKEEKGKILSPDENEHLMAHSLSELLKCAEKVQKTCKLSKDAQKMEMECIKKIWMEYGEKLHKIMQIHSALKQHIETQHNDEQKVMLQKYDSVVNVAQELNESIKRLKNIPRHFSNYERLV